MTIRVGGWFFSVGILSFGHHYHSYGLTAIGGCILGAVAWSSR